MSVVFIYKMETISQYIGYFFLMLLLPSHSDSWDNWSFTKCFFLVVVCLGYFSCMTNCSLFIFISHFYILPCSSWNLEIYLTSYITSISLVWHWSLALARNRKIIMHSPNHSPVFNLPWTHHQSNFIPEDLGHYPSQHRVHAECTQNIVQISSLPTCGTPSIALR